ncbi:dual 3',5'-cyclic-AMP and -GMP phosphodiesterase 11A-like [Bacillus rossius redtenbacheri]|uniref:dual 3',5'-cyclic-AMP and -GMP phosphodiesterase 11A-like n=1 Tax=Bacillus rossius redtenbacheri TaxID=93214 RepID=UPI002FDCDD01
MTQLSRGEVEEWLDSHPDLFRDYLLRKADLPAVNAWLVARGFPAAEDPGGGGGGSSDGAASPTPPPAAATHRRAGSKRCLRHDFARSKSRSVFRTHEAAGSSPDGGSSSRRSSLKDMRKYTSLPPSSAGMLSLLMESKVRLPRCAAPPSDRAAKRELLRAQGERDFFLGAVRDAATELDLRCLSRKTVDNLAVLLDADGASLFLVEGPRGGRRRLVSKVFDVHSGVSRFLLPGGSGAGPGDNEVQLPWGVGVLGHVADTGETVNLQVACEDPRFDDEVDRIVGYHTDSLLCMPVRDAYGEVVAVAQVVNKSPDVDGGHFTRHDEKVFETYLQFVGIAITNAQIVEASRQEYDRNRNLLEVVHDLFEEQTSLEQVILKIMQRAQKLLECERAAVLLLDEAGAQPAKFSELFELASPPGSSGPARARQPLDGSSMSRYMLGLAEQVAETGDRLNVAESVEVEKGCGGNFRSLLAMPIRNRHYQIIGVATIVNKINGLPFDENDEQLFEAFSIFCGLGIHNTLMYGEVERSMAKQKVAIEVLSYHATASNKEVELLMERAVPSADEANLYSLSFDDFSLADDDMVLAAVSMFLELGLVQRFAVDKETLYRFLITVKRNYRDVPYHNWRHAFSVAQVMFAILMTCEMKETFSDLEVLGMFVGCLCHDLDHRGTNNSFQQKTGSALVLLYGTTNTMEHHHFNHAVMILSSESHNIFSGLSPGDYSLVMQVLKHSILATDLSTYFQLRPRFFALVESRQYGWALDEHRLLLRSMLMTAADLAAACKPWAVQRRVAALVAAELLVQGDQERRQLLDPPSPPVEHELPPLQTRWIADICLPLYQSLGQMNPKLGAMAEGAASNMASWALLAGGAGLANGHEQP